MARIICIINQKGGVGKTTTAINLSAALSERGYQTLLVDMDPQGNASSGLGLKKHEHSEHNTYQLLLGHSMLGQASVETSHKMLNVVVSTADLAGAELELVEVDGREYRLKQALEARAHSVYDYVLIDCPPSLGLLTLNALTASDSFLVPLQCEYYALEGLSQLLNTAGLIKKTSEPTVKN